ncbi:hypothetical protein WAE56_18470, partial [Iodobacter sp. LRB]
AAGFFKAMLLADYLAAEASEAAASEATGAASTTADAASTAGADAASTTADAASTGASSFLPQADRATAIRAATSRDFFIMNLPLTETNGTNEIK